MEDQEKRGYWNHFKYLLRRKRPDYESEEDSKTTFCAHCHKPAKIRWINEYECIGDTEPFYNGMHLECFKATHFGNLPKIFKLFEKDDQERPGAWDLSPL